MVKIKSVLDLRSPEFIASRRFFKPVSLCILAVICFTGMVIGFCYGLTSYINRLQREVLMERASVRILASKTVPLTGLSEEVTRLENKYAIENSLREPGEALSFLLQGINETALSSHVKIESITIDQNRTVLIEGSGTVMQDVSLFNNALTELPAFSSSVIASIERYGENTFNFSISGRNNDGKGESSGE